MPLRLHDTRSRRKMDFVPLDPDHIRLYVCGPTVYDYAHIGNARPVIVFDTLVRLLRRSYPKVTYVRNITDVDDKINQRAQESGEPIAEITKRTHAAYREDMAALNAAAPDIEPRATEHIGDMIAMIGRLIASAHAYVAEGHVLFSVSSYADYGKLSHRSQEEMLAGARVDIAPYKKHAGDFVLWKPSDADLPGWESPWGRGRPGWHIECSAMSSRYLGEDFDIHGGGHDLVFPHHENEIAQSCCAHPGSGYARYWMHNGHLMVEGQKMSKSLGNFITVRQLRAHWPGEVIRLAMLATHYRQPINWTEAGLHRAKEALDRFYTALRGVAGIPAGAGAPAPAALMEALRDDLNTPLALSELHGLVGRLNKARSDKEKATLKAQILDAGALLGVLAEPPDSWFKSGAETLDAATIEALITERTHARQHRNFAQADKIRDQLAAKGVVLEDSAGGTTWKHQESGVSSQGSGAPRLTSDP